jgi:predicted metal-binding membrane protein
VAAQGRGGAPGVFAVFWVGVVGVVVAWGILFLFSGDGTGLLTGGPALMTGATRGMHGMTNMTALGMTLRSDAGPFSWAVLEAFLWMWTVMVMAMMLAVSLPALARRGLEPSVGFVVGGIIPWALFGFPVYGVLAALQSVFSDSGGRALRGAAVIVLGGALYEISGMKRRCRERCCVLENGSRWPDGLRLGAASVGCCGPMMVAFALVAMMNVVWMAALTVVMVLERARSWGPWLVRIAAGGLAASAVAVLVEGHHLPVLI